MFSVDLAIDCVLCKFRFSSCVLCSGALSHTQTVYWISGTCSPARCRCSRSRSKCPRPNFHPTVTLARNAQLTGGQWRRTAAHTWHYECVLSDRYWSHFCCIYIFRQKCAGNSVSCTCVCVVCLKGLGACFTKKTQKRMRDKTQGEWSFELQLFVYKPSGRASYH